ncbi:MAG: GHKL domain-containing protein [Eubacteriales bacterium]|nr:GHKL domain-containing protein [Eubacteriales bacterium]
MRKRMGAYVGLAAVCLICLPLLLLYAFPLGTQSADWTIGPEDGQPWQGENGWTVYVMRSGERVPLTPDENGGYLGCEPGETFYYARVWDADVAQPVLRIHAVNAAVAAWLDGELLYSDVPLPDAAIGAAALPMLDVDRESAVEIFPDEDAAGKVLTIGQASPLYGEKQGDTTVYPREVEVASRYGYERGLIAQAYGTGLMGTLLTLAALLTGLLAVRQKRAALWLLTLLELVRLCAVVTGAPFFQPFTRLETVDIASLADQLSFTLLLGFLTLQSQKGRAVMAALTAAHGASLLAALAAQLTHWQSDWTIFAVYLPDRLAVVMLVAALALCFRQYKGTNAFFRLFLRWFGLGLAAWLCAEIPWLALHPSTLGSMLSGQMIYARFLREPLLWLTQGAALIAVLILGWRQTAAAREQRAYDAAFAGATRQSYEALMRHQDEVMLLRHETTRHYAALKGFVDAGQTERASDYLNELLDRQQKIPQVISSGNELVNIILSSRISWAEAEGVRVDIRHMSVPASLPLPDADLVSLLLNIVDNAIEAARAAEPKVLRLDMHCKSDYFLFSCENTMTAGSVPPPTDGLSRHGYGRRIIGKIMAPYGDLVSVHSDGQWYGVSIALPLNAPDAPDAPSAQPLCG